MTEQVIYNGFLITYRKNSLEGSKYYSAIAQKENKTLCAFGMMYDEYNEDDVVVKIMSKIDSYLKTNAK